MVLIYVSVPVNIGISSKLQVNRTNCRVMAVYLLADGDFLDLCLILSANYAWAHMLFRKLLRIRDNL